MKQMPHAIARSRSADVDQPSGRSTMDGTDLGEIEAGAIHDPGAE
jgi:hypothetical protein